MYSYLFVGLSPARTRHADKSSRSRASSRQPLIIDTRVIDASRPESTPEIIQRVSPARLLAMRRTAETRPADQRYLSASNLLVADPILKLFALEDIVRPPTASASRANITLVRGRRPPQRRAAPGSALCGRAHHGRGWSCGYSAGDSAAARRWKRWGGALSPVFGLNPPRLSSLYHVR